MTAMDASARNLPAISPERQGRIGAILAAAVFGSWAILHVITMWFWTWTPATFFAAPLVIILQCWLYVGLFIVAHDCMHGSLVPFRPTINTWVGRVVLFAYAGFNYDALNRKHHLHHRHSGTAEDPDFLATPPHGFWPWYLNFMREYFGWRELIVLSVIGTAYQLAGVSLINIIVFWAIPAIASSLQLFTFGTYLPHRPDATPFTDRHRARSSNYSWLVSLLTCFHFGYHHEHHAVPSAPWWRLPTVRDAAHKSP